MPGKFLNEITADKPAKDDLGLFFDKSKNTTAQSSLVDIVAAGLDLTSGKAGEAPVVIETVNPDGTKTQSLGWAKTASSGAAAPPRPANSTDLIITHDPASGTDGAATPAQVLTAGLPAGGTAGDALTLATGGLSWTTPDKFPAITAGNQILLTKADKSGVEWAPIEKELPDFSTKPVGSRLATNSTKTGVEWVNPPAELPAVLGTAGQVLVVNAAATNPVWQYGLQMPPAPPSTNMTIKAASASTAGSGGNLILQGGANLTTGAAGSVIVQASTGSGQLLSLRNSSGTELTSFDQAGELLVRGLKFGTGSGFNSLNVAIGQGAAPALAANTTGQLNVAIGGAALRSSLTGSNNIAIGHGSLLSSTSSENVAVGFGAIGSASSGKGNTGVGFVSLGGVYTGAMNVGVGHKAGSANVAGTGIGVQNNCVFIGADTKTSSTGASSEINAIVIGHNAVSDGNNSTVIGNSATLTAKIFGALKIHSMADTAAPNGSLYFSTTANKLVYKDAAGLVNNLY